MTWAPPGKEAHPNRWRYDLRKGFVPPGHSIDTAGTQYEMQQGFDPRGDPKGFHVVESPPGTAAPIGAINYTPDTREVHDVGMLAPVDKKNLSLVPDSGLHKLAYNRRAQRQSAMGAGHDGGQTQQPFPGTPPLSSNFPNSQPQRQPQRQLQQPVWPNSGMSPTSAPPGAPYGRQPLGIGAGQDDETDPTAGVDQGSAPTTGETAGGEDPNWRDVGPEYTGHRRVDAEHIAEMVNGKPVGYWVKKPHADVLDANPWVYHSAPSQAAGGVTYTSEPQPDGSIILHGSNGDIRRVAAPKQPAQQSGKPFRDEAGNLVQYEANGNLRVVERAAAPKTPALTFGQPYKAPDGTWVQQGSNGEIRAVPGVKASTATERWGDPESKKDGSVWQQNLTTNKLEIVQPPDTKLTDPITVGNRLVKFDPESNSYKEMYRAPQNMSLQTLANGSIVGINQETGEQTPIMDDPTAAAAAGLKQRQGEQALRTGETSRQAAQMGMIPQPYVSGGNLIVPRGAEADVTDWNPLTGKTAQRVAGHHRTIPDILQGYGFEGAPAQPATYRPPAAPGASAPSSVPDSIASGDGAAVTGALAPGVTGTSADPMLQADMAGYTPPPDTGPQGGTDWLFSSPASPVANPANTPQAAPEAGLPDFAVASIDDPPRGTGAGADRGRSDQQIDLMRDIPRFAHKRRWKGLGSKFLGRGLDEFQPFVGVGQDGGPEPPAGPFPSPPPPAGSGGAAIPPLPAGGGLGGPPPAGMGGKPPGNWDPKQLQQLLPLLLMLLSGGGGGGAKGGPPPATPSPAPAATPPMPGSMAPGMGGGMGGPPGGMGMGQDEPQGFQPPIDPQHVVGTGHKFGQAMSAGDPVHRGVDLQAPKGTPVKAPVDGVVRVSQNPQGLGNEVIVVSPDGKEHKLGHLNTVSVKPGQQVRAGQPVGTVGDSGLTTGANLHYAEKKGGRYFNPSGKMGVMADLPPAPGTEMMSADGASGGGPPGAGQDMVPADREDRMAPQLPYAPVDGSPEILPSDISSWQSQARKWQRDVAMPSPGLVYRPQTDTPWKAAPRAFPVESGGDDGIVAGAGQDESIDPSSNFSGGAWSSGPGGQIQTRTQQLINSGVDPATAYNQASSAVSAGGRGYTGPSSGGGGGGGGGGTNVSIDPATQARLQLDTQVAQWDHDQKSASLQQSVKAEDDRHAEELQRLQQSATQEADWRAVQEEVNAENARHNQAQEQLTRQQQQLDVQLEQMKEQFQTGQTARQNALGVLQSSLSNPWIQALTKLGITPGGGASSGTNPLMGLLNQILGGGDFGNLQQAGVPGGNQLPNVTPQQFQAMNPAQKAGLRAQIEAMGPGMWEQFQANFQNQAGTSQAPNQTQLQQATWTPEDAAGSQMSAEMFGEGQPAFQQRQQKSWAPAQGTNVMQSLLSGTGFG